jgi:hypothetical protein
MTVTMTMKAVWNFSYNLWNVNATFMWKCLKCHNLYAHAYLPTLSAYCEFEVCQALSSTEALTATELNEIFLGAQLCMSGVIAITWEDFIEL